VDSAFAFYFTLMWIVEDHTKPPTWTFGLHTMPRHQICSIPGCFSRSNRQEFEGVKFHCIPQDPDLRHDWLVSIMKPITVSENSRFAAYTLKEVRKPPLPSIFPWSVSVKHRQPPAIRKPLFLKKQKHEKPPTPTQVKLDVARREIERHE